MVHVDVSPMYTRLPVMVDANPEPVMVSTVPTVMMAGDTEVTVGVMAGWYWKAHADPRPVLFDPHDAKMPLVHTRTLVEGSATWTQNKKRGGG